MRWRFAWVCREEVLVEVVEALVELEGEVGLLRNQRMARKPTRATAMSWGMLIEVCDSAMLGGGSVGL